jgi:hypothetical protein
VTEHQPPTEPTTQAPTPGRGEPTEGGIAVSPTEQLLSSLDALVGNSVNYGDSRSALERAREAEGNSTDDLSGISDGIIAGRDLIPTEPPPKRKRGRPRKALNSTQPPAEQKPQGDLQGGSGPAAVQPGGLRTPARWPVSWRRVWHAETQPNWRFLPIAKKARLAKLSKSQYYGVLREKAFADELVAFIRGGLLSDAANVTQAIVHNALMERGREGYKDRELFTRMTGVLPDTKISVAGQIAGKVTHEVGTSVADALRRARAAEAPDVGNRVIDVTPSRSDEG